MPKKTSKKTTKKAVKKVTRYSKAGRPKGSGKFGCATKTLRVPIYLIEDVLTFVRKKLKLPKK
jgi:hypothetical protein